MKRVVISIVLFVAVIVGLGFPYFHALSVVLVSTQNCTIDTVNAASERVANIYAPLQSQPIRLCLDSPKMGVDVSYGATHFLPLVPAINVLGPNGNNVDVIAHEWMHAEIEHELGFVMRNYRIPLWLDA